ncbi:MAG: SpoIIE family protein phosphatase, partial [Nostocaceae cyanobacterium CSU_2_110]|nr:SpoIIE family protein phosphatase [Nostocaceae cyanobacterium CSU_2_110]
MTMANAGHPPPYVRGADSNDVRELQMVTGYPLGVIEDAQYEAHTIHLPRPGLL